MPKIITPEFKPFTVHLTYLHRHGACLRYVEIFECNYGKKIVVTKKDIAKLDSEFDLHWFIRRSMISIEQHQIREQYRNLMDAAYDRAFAAFKKNGIEQKLLGKDGFVRSLRSEKMRDAYFTLCGERDAALDRARVRFFTRCFSHIGGKTFR